VKPPYQPDPAHAKPHRPTFKARVAGFLGRTWARVGYARHIEPTWLEINRIPLAIRGLPASFHGLKIAHLTDFHCGTHIPTGYLEDAIARTRAEQPDLIALTGDFIDRGPRHVADAAKLFHDLTAPLGVFAVLGNHDFSVHTARGVRKYPELAQAMTEALRAEGITVLRNDSTRLERGGEHLMVAGIDDLWSQDANTAAALADECRDTPRIVLTHNPQSVETFGERRADLVLSGHTHGGQIDWPGWGRILLRKKAKRWAAGLYTHNGSYIYVNKGVGFGWRFRFGVRPEVALFTLNPG
jgi:predicted MPP superfamily phosphohydrolase